MNALVHTVTLYLVPLLATERRSAVHGMVELTFTEKAQVHHPSTASCIRRLGLLQPCLLDP